MLDKDRGQDIDRDQIGRKQQSSIFDDDLVEDVDSVQEPYPANEVVDSDETMGGADVENPDEIHEYEDKDHPHEYRPPSAVIDDYKGSGRNITTDPFENQNPLQSSYPASDRDRR